MDAQINPQVISQDKTLADYIKRVIGEQPIPPVSNPNDYEVYPDDDGTDSPRNPYSRV